jgi:hypothetical protein
LRNVSAIGKESRSPIADQQGAGAASKAAQVADIGKMSDQEQVKFARSKGSLQPLQSAGVVHGQECSRLDLRQQRLESRALAFSECLFVLW